MSRTPQSQVFSLGRIVLRLVRSRKMTVQYFRALAVAFTSLLAINARSLPLVWHGKPTS